MKQGAVFYPVGPEALNHRFKPSGLTLPGTSDLVNTQPEKEATPFGYFEQMIGLRVDRK
jgi:hypothetical protein